MAAAKVLRSLLLAVVLADAQVFSRIMDQYLMNVRGAQEVSKEKQGEWCGQLYTKDEPAKLLACNIQAVFNERSLPYVFNANTNTTRFTWKQGYGAWRHSYGAFLGQEGSHSVLAWPGQANVWVARDRSAPAPAARTALHSCAAAAAQPFEDASGPYANGSFGALWGAPWSSEGRGGGSGETWNAWGPGNGRSAVARDPQSGAAGQAAGPAPLENKEVPRSESFLDVMTSRWSQQQPAGGGQINAQQLPCWQGTQQTAPMPQPVSTGFPPSAPVAPGMLRYVPGNATLNGTDFSLFLYRAMRTPGVQGVALAPGQYNVTPSKGINGTGGGAGGSHIVLVGTSAPGPFLLDLGGSILVFQNLRAGFVLLQNCTSVHVRGPATMYYALSQLPFSQGTITTVAPDRRSWRLEVHAGYPMDWLPALQKHNWVAFEPQQRRVRQNTTDAYATTVTALGGRAFNLSFSYVVPNVFPGDFAATMVPKSWHAVMAAGCRNATLEALTLHMGGCFGFLFSRGGGSRFIDNKILPYPQNGPSGPIGDGSQPALLATVADGIHIVDAGVDHVVQGNVIMNTGDDAIALHGSYYLVMEADPDAKSVTIALAGGASTFWLARDDTVYVYAASLELLGYSAVAATSAVPAPPAARNAPMDGPAAPVLHGLDLKGRSVTYQRITFQWWPVQPIALAPPAPSPKTPDCRDTARWAGLGYNCVVAPRSQLGSHFVIVNNTLGNNRGRGIIVKASHGLVARNAVLAPKFWGIQLVPEFFFREADFVANLTVADNTLDAPYGGVILAFIQPGSWLSSAQRNHHGIQIVGNNITNAAIYPLLISSASQVLVQGNMIADALCAPSVIGNAFHWVPRGALVFAENSSGLRFFRNSFLNAAACGYGNYSVPIQLGANVTDAIVLDA